MEGPRSPDASEFPRVIEFLNESLRTGADWSIANEYPTALTSTNLHNMRIIADDERILSHAVLKPLVIKAPHVILKVAAIGSVVTDPGHRKQGLSTRILEDCLAESTRQQADVAILWTDQYDFYRRMGFELAGTEISLVLNTPPSFEGQNLRFSADPKVSPEAIFRLYNQHTVGASRTSEEIRKFMSIPKTRIYTAWTPDGQLAAFAVEGKGADLGGYIHEWGGSVPKLIALLGWIGSQRAEPLTLIAPAHSRNLIEQLERLGAPRHEGYLGMLKVVNVNALGAKLKRAFRALGMPDFVLETREGRVVFGMGSELFHLNETADVTRLLFGPVDYTDLEMFSEESRGKLARVLPLPLWLWGWDSV